MLTFLLGTILICFLTLGLFLLAGGSFAQTPAPPAEEKTEPEQPKGPPRTVIIDAGHGGEDGGTSGNGGTVVEKDLNLTITKLIEERLTEKGISVICTRSEDILLYDKNEDYKGRKKMLDLAARLNVAKQNPNSVFVSIHMNAFPKSQYSGLQVYYSPNDPRSARLANAIQSNTKLQLQSTNNRASKKAGSNIYLLDRIESPAVLVECGFLSNPEECAKLADSDYQKRLSAVLADTIADFVKNAS